MTDKKEIKTQLIVLLKGPIKSDYSTPYGKAEIEKRFKAANEWVEIEVVEENPNVASRTAFFRAADVVTFDIVERANPLVKIVPDKVLDATGRLVNTKQ